MEQAFAESKIQSNAYVCRASGSARVTLKF
jgi:hypothetical protein